jgi:branched-chain amino acid transport system permease protein
VLAGIKRSLIFGLVVAGVLGLAAPALAEGEAIKGRLVAVFADERDPVEGVTVAVSQDGSAIGSSTSDADGRWIVPVPGPGTYQARIDAATLPEGVALTDSEAAELSEIVVREGEEKTVIFRLGEGTTSSVSLYQRLGSLTVLGLKLGAIIALAAVGLSLVFAVTGLVNFAHGEMVTLGAVVAYFFHASPAGPGWPLALAAIPAVIAGGLFGWIQEKGIWKPLRDRRTSLIAMMVVSIGFAFAVRNIILIVFDGEPRAFPDFAGQAVTQILGIPIAPKHLFTIGASLIILFGVGLFLQRTRQGTAMRAVADNKDLAESSGIDVDRIIAVTWIMAGLLAAVAGVLFGLTETVQWDMGFKLLLLIFAAVVLGGLGTTYGAVVGAFVVGLAVELSTFVVPSELKTAVGLIVLIIMLLIRPQGLLGSRERIG